MNYSMIAAPIIGSVIGYATNYIAVKMLFRPMKPITIGNYTLPFTPGIIPKGRGRLAHAIGGVVGNSLLSKDALKETLLTKEMKGKVRIATHQALHQLQTDERSINDISQFITTEDHWNNYKDQAIKYVAERIDTKLQDNPVGDIIAEKVIEAVKSNLQGGFLSLMLNDSILNPIKGRISSNIDDYLTENAKLIATPILSDELENLCNTKVSKVANTLFSEEESICNTIEKLYETIITEKLDSIFQSINIAQIVENQINQMDMKELESLILSVMKKELNAIVNLGALIGFILGLLNLLF